MRIIASMTTIPSRIDHIRPVIEAVLAQTVPISCLEINIPYFCVRTNEAYVLPPWLDQTDRLKIFRTDDYGAITKIAPTLLRYKQDFDTYIWSVDDDCAYPPNQLELLWRIHDPREKRILTRYGGKFDDGVLKSWYGEAEVTMFQGFGGVLYPPACIEDDFLEYLTATSSNKDCREGDDVVLSMYFVKHHLAIYLYNRPSDTAPYKLSGFLPHSERDALSHGGHANRYKRIFAFINSLWQSKDNLD